MLTWSTTNISPHISNDRLPGIHKEISFRICTRGETLSQEYQENVMEDCRLLGWYGYTYDLSYRNGMPKNQKVKRSN